MTDPMWACGHCKRLFPQSVSATLHVAECRSPVTEKEISDAKDNLALLVAQLSGGGKDLKKVTFMRTRTHTEIYEGFMPTDVKFPHLWFARNKDSLTKKGEWWFGDERIQSVSP